ncbi:MAG: dTDP-4-dehydrorhamnose 3,5-epimerase [Candidatus Hadarchaeum yellowstonense]|uniref:dTDP-4-dehydrorhamnose 3,5-epimerase n=1 Tax=Hadarchaeum yellowstonense TaxID=1776334 RepID=A0A147JY47_HADYE|nr:MAG: dTDP-4-dehydrorhamnose 3,5-epimerase [Candidatus Hadarchaeum yellowstonense]
MIEGVKIKKLRRLTDERGWLTEILRRDDEMFERFGQVYVTAAYTDVVKAWHMHKKQTDNMTCIKGCVKLVLYDGRQGSKTKGEINEFTIEDKSPLLVRVPPEVWHGFKAIGETAIIINIPTELYNYENPDEHRLPPDTDIIPYKWDLKPGLKHG